MEKENKSQRSDYPVWNRSTGEQKDEEKPSFCAERTIILDGNEEELTNFNCPISIDWRRNAVRVPKSTSYKTEIDLWGAAKEQLKSWEAEKLRDDISRAMLPR